MTNLFQKIKMLMVMTLCCFGTAMMAQGVLVDSTANASDCNTCDGWSYLEFITPNGVPFSGNGPYTFVLSDSTSTITVTDTSSNNASALVQGLCPNVNYYVEVYDANQNILGTGTVMAGCNAGTGCNISVAVTSNATGSITAMATGGSPGYTYAWNTGDITQTVSNLPGGYYCVTVTDAQGCTASACDTVGGGSGTNPANYIPSDTAIVDASNCAPGAACDGQGGVYLQDPNNPFALINDAAPYTFNWSDGVTTTYGYATDYRTDLCANTTYTVNIIDANGYQYSAVTFYVGCDTTGGSGNCNMNVALSASGASSLSATAAGGTAPYSFLWSNGQTTSTISNLNLGYYCVTVTDAQGCTASACDTSGVSGGTGTGNYVALDTAIWDASGCNVCDGGAGVILTDASNPNAWNIANNAAPYTFYWSDGFTDVNQTMAMSHRGNLCPGTYTVAITDANGTQYTYTVVVGGCNNNGGGTGTPLTCVQNYTVNLTPNGAYVAAYDLATAGANVNTYIIDPVTGTWTSGLYLSCADIGTQTYLLANVDSTAAGTVVDTCAAVVTVVDTMNVCGGQGTGGTVVDSLFANASDCSTCDGEYAFGYVALSPGSAAPAPYTIVWADGTTGFYRNDLCPNQAYTYTVYDALQNAYTHTISVGCDTTGGSGNTGCIDPALIDTMAACPAVVDPVCGCDGITYNNSCEAENWYGVTSWTQGPCNSQNQFLVNVQTGGSGCDTTCTGYALLTATGGTAPYTYLWSNGSTNSVLQGLCTGTYTVSVTDANGQVEVVTVVIGTAQGCVWPGDTDDNTSVNNWDLLPIALTFGESGLARPNASLAWMGQTAPDWNTPNMVPLLPNYKHIDANGDGLIDTNDLNAILQNYGNSYVRNTSASTGTIPLFVESGTADEGERIALPIHYGTAAIVATDAYGIAFTINYDPDMVDAGSVDVDFTDSWLGTDLLHISKDFSTVGQIEVAVARKDRQNINGFGQIGVLNLTISDDILRNSITQDMDVSISNVRAVNNMNDDIGADTQTGTVTIDITSSITEVEENFNVRLYPNPTSNVVNIEASDAQIDAVMVYTMTGQLVSENQAINNEQHRVDVSTLPSGIYMITIVTDKGIRNERINVQR